MSNGVKSLKPSVARVYRVTPDSQQKTTVGTGFLVTDSFFITCAHVVNLALWLPMKSKERPDGEVHLRFTQDTGKLGARSKLTIDAVASVWAWKPPIYDEDFEGWTGDMAVLKVDRDPRISFGQLQVHYPADMEGSRIRVRGFPASKKPVNGAIAHGIISGDLENGRFQIDRESNSPFFEQGFSGAPVWDIDKKVILGMMVTADYDEKAMVQTAATNTGHFIANHALYEILREIPEYTLLDAEGRPTIDASQDSEVIVEGDEAEIDRRLANFFLHDFNAWDIFKKNNPQRAEVIKLIEEPLAVDWHSKNTEAINLVKNEIIKGDHRIVLVFGSGVSSPSGIPGGRYLRDAMQHKLSKTKLSKKCQKEFDELITNENVPIESLYCIYARKNKELGLYKWLTRQYIPTNTREPPPCFPTFAHEFCSHLARIGVFKHFVSLNFDEVLESALEDELGQANFEVVDSKSEFERLDENLQLWDEQFGSRTPKCFVLKPHGTISRALTLQHFPKRVEHFDEDKKKVLLNVVDKALVILLGIGNYNEDFLDVLEDSFGVGSTHDLLVVSHSPENLAGELTIGQGQTLYLYRGEINDFFVRLFNELYDDSSVTKYYRHQPTRHYLRQLFFGLFSRELRNFDNEEEKQAYTQRSKDLRKIPRAWYDLRVYELELLMHLIKSRGLFNQVTALNALRIKQAYERCFASIARHPDYKDTDLRPYVRLAYALRSEDASVFRSKVVDNSGNPILNAEWCGLFFPNAQRACTRFRGERLEKRLDELSCEVFYSLAETYLANLKNSIGEAIKGARGRALAEQLLPDYVVGGRKIGLIFEFAKNFNKLFEDSEVDVNERDFASLVRFKQPEPIETRHDLSEQTKKLFSTDWDTVRTIALGAEWLRPEYVEQCQSVSGQTSKRTLNIITEIELFTRHQLFEPIVPYTEGSKYEVDPLNTLHYVQLARRVADLFETLQRWDGTTLNWYLCRRLDHHITVVTKDNDGPIDYKGAIYLYRPHKRTFTSPVYLSDNDDVKSLCKYFEDLKGTSSDLVLHDLSASGLHLGGHLLSVEVKNGKLLTDLKSPNCNFVKTLLDLITRLKPGLFENWPKP